MNWYKLLISQVAYNSYGFWIEPGGRSFPVTEDHLATLNRKGIDNYEEAFTKGWIRVTTGNMMGGTEESCGFEGYTKPTPAQVSALMQIGRDMCEKVRIELPGINEMTDGKKIPARLRPLSEPVQTTSTVPEMPDALPR